MLDPFCLNHYFLTMNNYVTFDTKVIPLINYLNVNSNLHNLFSMSNLEKVWQCIKVHVQLFCKSGNFAYKHKFLHFFLFFYNYIVWLNTFNLPIGFLSLIYWNTLAYFHLIISYCWLSCKPAKINVEQMYTHFYS